MPAFTANERAFTLNRGAPAGFPSMLTDTIYQIDTVYLYEYVYDTIYYFEDTAPPDTLLSETFAIEENDSVLIVNKKINLDITESRTVYAEKSGSGKGFEGRIFRTPGEGELPETGDGSYTVYNTGPLEKNPKDYDLIAPVENFDASMIPRYQKDTLYRFDTIVNFIVNFDTIYFESKAKPDTSVSSQKSVQSLGKSVLVKETVNMKVTNRENVFAEKPGHEKEHNGQKPGNMITRKKSNILTSRQHNLLRPSSRVGEDKTYSGALRAGMRFFIPDINFAAEDDEIVGLVEDMNSSQTPENSYGFSVTYNYFADRFGFETGLGFSKFNLTSRYDHEDLDIDTTFYWSYFDKEAWQYDTTWYIDIDHLLQTGDTLLVPNADSSLIMVTDSAQQMKFDSSYYDHSGKYSSSYSFLEIPIIGHFSVVDKKFFLRIAAGAVPMFVISKKGNLTYPDSDGLVNAGDISFDYGFCLSLYGSVIFGYRFDDRWAVFAEPYLQQNVYSAIRNDEVRLKPGSWGVKAGLSYRLFYFQSNQR